MPAIGHILSVAEDTCLEIDCWHSLAAGFVLAASKRPLAAQQRLDELIAAPRRPRRLPLTCGGTVVPPRGSVARLLVRLASILRVPAAAAAALPPVLAVLQSKHHGRASQHVAASSAFP